MTFSKCTLLPAVLTLFMMTGCNESVETSAPRSLPQVEVQVETLNLSTVPGRVELLGTLQAVEHATIAARVTGQVVKLPIKVGLKVNKGDLLVKISANEINAQVRQAEIQLEQARRNLERESRLFQVDASTRETVKTLDEQVKISEAALREAQAMLSYTDIKAPFTGTVTEKLVEVGDMATPGATLLKLENSATHEVVIQVPEVQAQNLNLETRLPVTIPAADLVLEAKIQEISPTVDPSSRTSQVKLILPNLPELRSGQFARVTLVDSWSKTLLINRTALRQNGQMQQVFVADDGKAQMRLVRTGAEIDERIEILSGLRAGDRIIVKPPATLRDGQPLVIAGGSKQ